MVHFSLKIKAQIHMEECLQNVISDLSTIQGILPADIVCCLSAVQMKTTLHTKLLFLEEDFIHSSQDLRVTAQIKRLVFGVDGTETRRLAWRVG